MLPNLTGRMYLFYGNKTSVQFVTFTTTVTCPGELQSHILHIYTCKHMFILAYTCCDKVNFICLGDYLRMLVVCWLVAIPWLIPQLNVQTKPVEPLIEGGAQVQQVINIECLSDFCDAPLLNIKFRWQMHAFKWFTMVNQHTLRFTKLLCISGMAELSRTSHSSCPLPLTSSSSPQRWHHMTSFSAGNSSASKCLCVHTRQITVYMHHKLFSKWETC